MKTMRNTFFCTFLIAIASLSALLIFERCNLSIYNISLAIFGSALLTAISSLVGYFVERKRSLEEYYSCLEKIISKFSRYKECSIDTLESSTPYDDINLLKTVFSEDLRELGNRYANICFLCDPGHKYRNFIYASYDYINDIKLMTSRERAYLSAALSRKDGIDLKNGISRSSYICSQFEIINHIFIVTDIIAFPNNEAVTRMTITNNRVSDDLSDFLGRYMELMNIKPLHMFCNVFKKTPYNFSKSIVDDTTFNMLDEHYHALVKKIVDAKNKQNTWSVAFSDIKKDEAKYFMDNHYISGFNSKKESLDEIISLEINDKLYYYDHFLDKYQKNTK